VILGKDGIFLASMSVITLGPTLSFIQFKLEFFYGVELPEREAHHSSPSSAEVKNAWSFTTPTCLHGASADMKGQRHVLRNIALDRHVFKSICAMCLF
jgi:hypothetical protein